MLGSVPCRKSLIIAEFLIVKIADVFSNHAIMHDSFSIVAAITSILSKTPQSLVKPLNQLGVPQAFHIQQVL